MSAAADDATGPDERRFRTVLVAAFAALAVTTALRHEPWRDELADWGAALDAANFDAFAAWARTTGHGIGWPAAVFALQRTVGDVRALLLLHAALATASVAVVACCAPLPRVHRVLFALGLLPFFEWGVLARPYGATLLFAVAACAAAPHAARRPLAAGAALALLAQTNAYGIVLAAALGAGVAVLALRDTPPPDRRTAACAAVLVASAAATTIWFTLPQAGTWMGGAWRWDVEPSHVRETLGGIVETFLPFRASWLHLRTGAWWILAPLLAGAVTWTLRRSPAALATWSVAAAGLVTFGHAGHAGAARHRGHLFIAFFAACWFAEVEARRRRAAGTPATDGRRRRNLALVLIAAQVPAGIYAAARDLAGPYSASAAAAAALREEGLDGHPIVADPEYPTAPVGALLGRSLHYPATGRTSATSSFGRPPVGPLEDRELVLAARETSARLGADVVVLVTRELPQDVAPGPPVRVVPAGIVPDERYWIYVVRRP